MIVALLRHGRTEWNDVRRMQGRADISLSDAGRAQVAAWRLPAALAGARIVASPLARAIETARLLCGTEPAVERRLREVLLAAREDPAATEALNAYWGTTGFRALDDAMVRSLARLRTGVARIHAEVE